MTPDPTKQAAGRRGGLATGRKRLAHLSDAERRLLYELESMARAYRDGTHGEPAPVAAWLRIEADELILEEEAK